MRNVAAGSIGIVAIVLNVEVLAQSQQIGAPLSVWTAGVLEIHQISTGVGNAALLILPDGTSLLVDSGESAQAPATARRPDASRTVGTWVGRYVRHMLRHDQMPALDYALVTHLHGDHMSGLSDVAEQLPMRKLLDRGWPDYRYPLPVAGIESYRSFLNGQQQNRGLRVERFEAGRNDQIRLVRDPTTFPAFEVRNIAVNGTVRTGQGTTTRGQFPPLQNIPVEDYPEENATSAAIRVQYGRFTYFTAGDLTGAPSPPGAPAWIDMETAIAPVVGPVEVSVLNHHGMGDATNETFLRALRPLVVVIPAWAPVHPDFDVVLRLMSPRLLANPPDIFTTGMWPETRTVLTARRVSQFKSQQGHVVIRVDRGGNTFQVIVLDDSTESFAVKAVFGPYQAN